MGNNYRYRLAKITAQGIIYLVAVKIIAIQVIKNDEVRKCCVDKCDSNIEKFSAFCFQHWYDFQYNPSKLRKIGNKIISVNRKKGKKKK